MLEKFVTNRRAVTKVQAAIIAVVIIVAAVVGVGAWWFTRPSPPKTIKIGAPHAMTGEAAWFGKVATAGAQIAIDEINEEGGVLGMRLELVIEDGQCLPEPGLAAVEKLIHVHKVDFLIGATCSGVTLTTAPIVCENKIPQICHGESHPDITRLAGVGGWDYIFSQYPRDDERAWLMVKYMIEKKGHKSFCWLSIDNEYGRGVYMAAEEATEEYGGTILSSDFHLPGEVEYRPILTKVKGLGPDAFVINTYMEDGAKIVKQAYELGLHELMSLYSFCCVCNYAVLDLIGADALEGLTEIECWEVYGADAKKFAEEFEKRTGEKPTADAALPYMSVKILAEAIKAAGTTDREAVKDALKKLRWSFFGISVAYFDEHNHAAYPLFIKQMKAGKIEIIDIILPPPP